MKPWSFPISTATSTLWKPPGAKSTTAIGSCAREVLAWISDHHVLCVQGNHDAWLALNYHQGDTVATVPEVEQAWVHLNAGLLNEACEK